jgi:protein-disulfide isomerase/rhodanese-related sulfurtransferase/uncharacterized membrane protein
MRKLFLLGLSLAGLFDSGFLWWVYTSPTHAMACLGTGCDVVRASSYSHLWGISVPIFGIALYSTLAALVFADALANDKVLPYVKLATALVSAGGFLGSLYFTWIEAFVIHAWCVWCLGSAVAATLIFLLAMLEVYRPSPRPGSGGTPTPLRRYAALVAVATVLSVPAFKLLARTEEVPPPPPPVPQEVLREHLVRPDSHSMGNLDSPVTVVEFGDFQCPVCGIAEKTMRKIRDEYGGRVRFVFRQFPLTNIHAHAEKAAEASECAAEQGKFWEAFEKFYDHQDDLTLPALGLYSSQLGLDRPRFEQCVSSGAMAARVGQDVGDGRALGVDRTPVFFVDGERIAGIRDYDEFTKLLDQALARHGVRAQDETAKPTGTAANAPSKVSNPPPSNDQPAGSAVPAATGLLGDSGSNVFSQAGSLAACSESEAMQRQPALIDTAEARRLHQEISKVLFVDVRTAREYNSARIAKAINLPLGDVEKRWTTLPKNQDIVLYEGGNSAQPDEICAAGRAAGRFLLSHGFSTEHVKVYRDGLKAWENAGLPVEHGFVPLPSPKSK